MYDDLFKSEVKMKLCLVFRNVQNGRNFQVAKNFFTGSNTEVEYASKIAMSISDILSFWSTL